MCAKLQIHYSFAVLQMKLLWWDGGGRAGGECSLVWAAMMVVPNCQCAPPTLTFYTSSLPVPPPSRLPIRWA